jgi:hypothetical protein
MRIHRLVAISEVLLLGLFLAGCGGSSSSSNDPPTNNDPPGGDTGGDIGGGGGSATSAAECFNAELFVSGAKFETVSRTTNDGGAVETSVSYSAAGAAIFPPTLQEATKLIANVSGDVASFTVEFYLGVNPAIPEIREYGEIVLDPAETNVNDPYDLDRFDLEPGETYEWAYSQEDDGLETTIQTTYVGRESVTVPAGTFETCRFDRIVTERFDLGGSVLEVEIRETEWFGVGNGLLIKGETEEPDAEIIELLSASINSVPVSP